MRTVAAFISLFIASSVLATPQTTPQMPPEFTVSGYGKVVYTVDIADIQFSVSVRDKNVQVCKSKHDEIINTLNTYLVNQEYPKEILSLENTILRREKGASNNQNDDYYLAKSTYSIRTSRITELSSLQADIVELGVDEIQFVKLFSSKQRELEDQARKQSIEDAMKKASLTAKELGWILDRPTKVSYTTTPWQRGFGSRDLAMGAAQSVASSNYVDVTVQVTFSYTVEDG